MSTIKHPIRAERDPVTGCVLVWDHRPKNKHLIELVTPERAEALMLDLQRAHIDEMLARLDAKAEPPPRSVQSPKSVTKVEAAVEVTGSSS